MIRVIIRALDVVANSNKLTRRIGIGTRKKIIPSTASEYWSPSTVSAAHIPEANLRRYLERKLLRSFLNEIPIDLDTAADVGCGFGRLTMTLTEFAQETIGYERNAELARIADTLLSDVKIKNVESLFNLPIQDNYFSFVMTFTVLQHLDDAEAQMVISELKRIAKPGSYILLVEETNSLLETYSKWPGIFTAGRTINKYETLMEPLTLIKTAERRVEPTNPDYYTGHYMLFSNT